MTRRKYGSIAEQTELVVRAQAGDLKARNQLIESNMGFVYQLAREYIGGGIAFDDLVNDGVLGLMEAVGRFDVTRGYAFLTYAGWYVRKNIRERRIEMLSPLGGCTRGAYNRGAAAARAMEAARAAGAKDEHEATGMAAQALGSRRKTIAVDLLRFRESFSRHRSMDEQYGDYESAGTVGDHMADTDSRSAYDHLADKDLVDKVRARIAEMSLSASHRLVVEHRFMRGETLEQVAEKLGVTRERIRQIEAKLMPKLRKWLAGLRASISDAKVAAEVRSLGNLGADEPNESSARVRTPRSVRRAQDAEYDRMLGIAPGGGGAPMVAAPAQLAVTPVPASSVADASPVTLARAHKASLFRQSREKFSAQADA